MVVKRGQTATEYLIILAVVIIIALIVVVALGGIPGIGTQTTARVSASYWATADVAIKDIAISASGTDVVIVQNNLKNTITINDLIVNGVDISSGTNLGPGGTATLTGEVASCTAGQSFSYDVVIYYQDSATSANYNFTGNGQKIAGTCAE